MQEDDLLSAKFKMHAAAPEKKISIGIAYSLTSNRSWGTLSESIKLLLDHGSKLIFLVKLGSIRFRLNYFPQLHLQTPPIDLLTHTIISSNQSCLNIKYQISNVLMKKEVEFLVTNE